MTGIERLRNLAGAWDVWGLGGTLAEIANQIERERACDADTIENVRLIVGGVVDEMERHVSGVEGAEDSPVARWARELRDALRSDTSDAVEQQNPSCADPDGAADVTSDAPKVTRDPAEDVSMSAYDLLPQDERDAIAWVREHGGLERVRRHWDGYVPAEWLDRVKRSCERKRDRLKGHAWELERKCAERRERIRELERQRSEAVSAHLASDAALYDLRREVRDLCEAHGVEPGEDPLQAMGEALDRRLMPDGMEWPRFEDGEPVRIGDAFAYGDETFYVDSIQLLRWEFHLWATNGTVVTGSNGERCERPAPKVLDADGVEVEVGDAVWWVHNKTGNFRIIRIEQDGKCAIHDDDADEPCGMTVPSTELTHKRPVLDADGAEIRVGDRVWSTQLDEPHEWIVIDPHGDRDDSQTVLVSIGDRTGRARPENLTHRAPVLAADGRPLREGETVWNVKTGERYVVGAFAGGCVNVSDGRGGGLQLLPAQLTHERPIADTWERLEEDADRTASLFDAFDSGASADIRDLVRRARALAGVPS